MNTRLNDLLLDIVHNSPLDESGTTIMDIESIEIRDDDEAGRVIDCVGVVVLPNRKLALYVSRKDKTPCRESESLYGASQAQAGMTI